MNVLLLLWWIVIGLDDGVQAQLVGLWMKDWIGLMLYIGCWLANCGYK